MALRKRTTRIAFTLTSHGYGHMTRSLAVLREFLGLYPQVEATVCTTIPRDVVAREISRPFRYRARDYEPGTAQKNCFLVDKEATRTAYGSFLRELPGRLREEESFLEHCHGLVSDIPALPVRAASNVGIRAIGFSNFTWDWILEPLLEDTELSGVPGQLAEDYASGDLLLRLPFSPLENPFPRSEDVPLVGRLARLQPEEVRRRLGIETRDPRKLVLVCAGGWGTDGWSEIRVAGCEGFRWLLVGGVPLIADGPVIRLPSVLPEGLSFPDLVQACDAVLTKPGYGIASECLLHRTPLVGVERTDFRETAELVRVLRTTGPFAELSLEDFGAGRWEPALRAALSDKSPWREFPRDGAAKVARRLGDCFEID